MNYIEYKGKLINMDNIISIYPIQSVVTGGWTLIIDYGSDEEHIGFTAEGATEVKTMFEEVKGMIQSL